MVEPGNCRTKGTTKMTPEREPQLEPDMFLDDLKRYMLDVMALEADGMDDIDNNRFHLAQAFDSMLERLGVTDLDVVEKLSMMLPLAVDDDLDLHDLVLQYKLAPLKLIDQNLLDPVLPLEVLTPQRIEAIFNHSLADEEEKHADCITGDEQGNFGCEQATVCPMRFGRYVGKDLLRLLAIQRRLDEGDIEPQLDPAVYNLSHLRKVLIDHELMVPGEVDVHINIAVKYIEAQLRFLGRPDLPRTNDGTNNNDF